LRRHIDKFLSMHETSSSDAHEPFDGFDRVLGKVLDEVRCRVFFVAKAAKKRRRLRHHTDNFLPMYDSLA